MTPFVAVTADGAGMEEVLARFRWSRNDGLIEATPAKLRALGFSPAEIAAAGEGARDLALERVARVDVVK